MQQTQLMEQALERILLPQMDAKIVSQEIGDFIIATALSNTSKGAIVGLSGGVDSTTTAALAQQAFERYNAAHGTSLELVGYILPSKTNDAADTRDGIAVAQRLGIRYEVQSIEPVVEAYRNTNAEAFENQYDKGNLTSRIRATVLNTKASTENKNLLGTGNKDEDFGIGYYTLFGDGAVHSSPIGGLSKRLVREMASHLGFNDLAYREPTAGLEPGQTDFKDLGYRYDLVEVVTEGLAQGFSSEQLARHQQVIPLFEQQQRTYAAAYGAPKFSSAESMVDDIARRHQIAAAKADILHPPTPEITLEYR